MIETPIFTIEVPSKGAVDGHVHYVLQSVAPADVLAAFLSASITSSVLFERLQAQGTNIIITLGENTGTVDVLSRKENDGLSLQWQPKQIAEKRMTDLQSRIEDALDAAPAKESPKETAMQETPPPKTEDEEYLVRQITRIP